jgi:hypothetical protein
MKRLLKLVAILPAFGLLLFAGALTLQVADPAANQEAVRSHAVVVVQVAACRSPEKTSVVATAEGLVNGIRRTVPLKVIALSSPGTFVVAREWAQGGNWAVKVVATNPDYKNYATSVVVPVRGGLAQLNAASHYYHAPSDAEVSLALN